MNEPQADTLANLAKVAKDVPTYPQKLATLAILARDGGENRE